MARKLITASVALLIAGSLAAPSSAATRERTARAPYMGTGGFAAGTTVATIQTGTNWPTFVARPGERWVTVSIQDDVAGAVLGRLSAGGREVSFCGTTKRPIRVIPGETIYVGGMVGLCDGSPSVVTTGEVEVTFSR